MRRIVLLFLILTVFLSGSYAESFSAKSISGTEFTLLSNTDQCLSNCEAWIQWDLSKGIASNVFIPSKADSLFDFELIKAKSYMGGLEDFGIEVWEEQTREILDYCGKEQGYDFPKKDLDLNASCTDIGCISKDEINCACTEIVRSVCGSHFETSWEKVSENFYGFEAVKNKIYRLRVWGKKKASLLQNNVDWIPTFFGQKVTEWAWWNASWDNKIPITLNTSDILELDVTQDMVIAIDINSDQADFWANIQSDGDDIRFVAANDSTELDFYLERFDYDNQEAIAWVEVTDTFPAASDLTIYTYFGNVAAASGQKFRRNVYPDMYLAGWDFNELTGTIGYDVVDGDANNLTHVNTPTLDSNGIVNGAIKYEEDNAEYSFNNGTFLDGERTELSIVFWFDVQDGFDIGEIAAQLVFRKVNSGTEEIDLRFNEDTGELRFALKTNGVQHRLDSTQAVWTAEQYYHVIATFDTTANDMNLFIDGSLTGGGSLSEAMDDVLGGATGNLEIPFNVSPLDGNMDAIRIYNKVLTAEEIAIIYNSERNAFATFGVLEAGAGIDLNISTINGLAFSTHPMFAFGLDGNITVDFNVFDLDNERLTIDLNYSPNRAQGTGTVIVKDLNLVSSICIDQDWDDVPSECSYSWDFSGADDGNYSILGWLDNGTGTDFNNSDANFQIANDINLVVMVPINEETGVAIDTSTYSFIVRINANGILSVFDNQLDQNNFSVPISSDFILVEIDTNAPAVFNSRVYSFLFEEAQATEVLQPYLAPVAASILTTVKTLQFENLKPIPDVRLQVFKDLTGGRTLIHDSVTDGKGETTIPFIVADLYEIDVLVDGVLIFTESYIATATTNEHFIFISETGPVPLPEELSTPSVFFTPGQSHFNTVDVNLGVIVSSSQSNIAAIHFFITNNDFNIFDGGLDSGDVADGNTYSVNINDLQDVSDTNFAFVSSVIVILDDGNSFVFSASYSLRPGGDEVLNILMYDMRDEFGCNTSDLSVRCDGLMFIAFFIVLFVMCAFAVGARGILGGEGLVLLGLVLFGFFTFIAWVPLWLFIVMIFAAVGVILTRTRFIGA